MVFNYQQSHIKLLANRHQLTTNKTGITWRAAAIREDNNSVFSYNLDTANTRSSNQLYVTLNKVGLYEIEANACRQLSSGTGDAGLTIDIAFPNQSPVEVAYGESTVNDFDTVTTSIPFRVLPSQVGTQIFINAKATNGVFQVRGYHYATSSYDAGADTGSYLDITYQGP
jgi:hypothetical protein